MFPPLQVSVMQLASHVLSGKSSCRATVAGPNPPVQYCAADLVTEVPAIRKRLCW